MKRFVILVLFLFACAQAPEPLPIVAQESTVVSGDCANIGVVGESCVRDCDCARPLSCLGGSCAQTRLADGELCTKNEQCINRYCTESGQCGGPDGPNLSYSCERECKDKWTGEPLPCHTVCRER